MNASAERTLSRRELLVFLYKYRRRLTLAFLIPFMLFFAVSFIPVPRYKAESVLIVRLGSEYVYQPEGVSATNSPVAVVPFTQEQIFKSEVAILNSDDLHEQVIRAIGLETLFPELVHPTGLSVITAPVRSAINEMLQAAGMVPKPTDEELQHIRTASAVELFDKRFDLLLQKDSAVINVSFEHKDYNLAMRALNTLLDLYFEKRRQLYLEPRVKLAQAEAQATEQRALAAEQAVERYKRGHKLYSLADQRAELLDKRSKAQERALAIASPALERQIASYTHQLDALGAQEREFGSLQKEEQIASDAHSLYARKLDEARTSEDLQHERLNSVRMIQPPTVPAEPRRLQWVIILAGVFVSLVSMLATAALTEFSHNGFLTPEQIERSLGLPVLAVMAYRSNKGHI